MKEIWLLPMIPGCLVVFVALFVLMLLLVKLLWAWTVPDLFPGAVEQGLVAASISWLAALKLALFIAVLGGASGLHGRHHQGRSQRT